MARGLGTARNRLTGRRGFGGGGGGGPSQAVGIEGFTTSDFYRTALGTFIAGSGTGFGVAMAVHVLAVPSASEFLAISANGVTRGFTLRTSVAALRFDCANGAGAAVSSPTSTVALADVGETLLIVGLHDGSNVRLYRARAEVGSGTAITGYTAASVGTDTLTLGMSSGATNPAASFRILGATFFTGVPTLSDIQAWDAATQAALDVQDMGGSGVVTTDRWQARDAGSPPGATWAADVGGKALSLTGSLTRTAFTPTWE